MESKDRKYEWISEERKEGRNIESGEKMEGIMELNIKSKKNDWTDNYKKLKFDIFFKLP